MTKNDKIIEQKENEFAEREDGIIATLHWIGEKVNEINVKALNSLADENKLDKINKELDFWRKKLDYEQREHHKLFREINCFYHKQILLGNMSIEDFEERLNNE